MPTLRTLFAIVALFLIVANTAAEEKKFEWNKSILKHDQAWYETADAKAIANAVLQHQAVDGGWPKSVNLAVAPKRDESTNANAAHGKDQAKASLSTFDNDGTTLPLQFLARMVHATKDTTYLESFNRGLDYTLTAQYSIGGWPQYFPLRKGYHSHITFNDNAMIRVMTLLRDVAEGEDEFVFVDAERRAAASNAVTKGIQCILKTQIRQGVKLTGWCAQYDAVTLEPAWARAYEPPSLSGSESVGIVRFLMELDEPTPQIKASIEGAIEWLRTVAIQGVRYEKFTNADGKQDRRMVKDASAKPLWARFYELRTHRPIFLDRDSIVRYDISEIDFERRNGYSYLGDWPAGVLDKNYPRWKQKYSDANK